ncbi:MAG: right-handed parallel beta-helix repeat-containing protein [Candidatus Thiodiazotropha sp.]
MKRMSNDHYLKIHYMNSEACTASFLPVVLGFVLIALLLSWQSAMADKKSFCGPKDKGLLFKRANKSRKHNLFCHELEMAQSQYICATPELRHEPDVNAPTTLLLTPDACGDLAAPNFPPLDPAPLPWVEPSFWQRCIDEHEEVTDFLVQPGDYTNWGRLWAYEASGLPEHKRVIRYWGPLRDLHPAHRLESGPNYEATISGFSFSDASNWILHGLTVRHPSHSHPVGFIGFSGSIKKTKGSYDVIVDSMLIENSVGYGIRISGGSRNCVQNSIIRNSKVGKADRPGIQIKPFGNTIDDPTVNNRIINNEIYNFGDSIAITSLTAQNPGNVDGTIIDENDFYLTPDYISNLEDGRSGCTENGIDIKVGSDDSSNPVLIKNNRIWGTRFIRLCGGTGDGIVVHQQAKNIEIRQNIIFDLPVGLTVKIFPDNDPPLTSRNILIERNLFYGIKAFRNDNPLPSHDAAILSLQTPEIVRDNIFAHSDRLFAGDVKDSVTEASVFEDNQVIAIPDLDHVPPGFFSNNMVWEKFPRRKISDYSFWTNRWACCNTKVLKKAFVHKFEHDD